VNAPSPAATANPGDVEHPAGAADLAADHPERKADKHCVCTELPDENLHQHDGQYDNHKCCNDYVDRPPSARRLVRGLSRFRFWRHQAILGLSSIAIKQGAKQNARTRHTRSRNRDPLHPNELLVDVPVTGVDHVPPLAVPVASPPLDRLGQSVGRPLPSDS
jgi:hypothetical protein